MAEEQRRFGAGLVIFRQLADALEQMRTGLVIEIFAGDFLRRFAEAGDQAVRKAFVPGRGRMRRTGERCVHQISAASRIPLNCQRAWGGKKLR